MSEIVCRIQSGGLTFMPPLTGNGHSYESIKVQLTADSCTSDGKKVSGVSTAVITGSSAGNQNNCVGILTSRPASLMISWEARGLRPTIVNLSGYIVAPNSLGREGLLLPNKKDGAQASGSFVGTDRGDRSHVAAYSTLTANKLLSVCTSPSGLSSLAITTGKIAIE